MMGLDVVQLLWSEKNKFSRNKVHLTQLYFIRAQFLSLYPNPIPAGKHILSCIQAVVHHRVWRKVKHFSQGYRGWGCYRSVVMHRNQLYPDLKLLQHHDDISLFTLIILQVLWWSF